MPTVVHPFELLAEPIRRRIVELLASGEHSAGNIAAVITMEFRVGRPAVSNHLRVLRQAGFVDVRTEETRRIYRLAWNAIDQLELAVDYYRELWDRRIGYPYRTVLPAPPGESRIGRKGRRGRWRPSSRREVEISEWEDLWEE